MLEPSSIAVRLNACTDSHHRLSRLRPGVRRQSGCSHSQGTPLWLKHPCSGARADRCSVPPFVRSARCRCQPKPLRPSNRSVGRACPRISQALWALTVTRAVSRGRTTCCQDHIGCIASLYRVLQNADLGLVPPVIRRYPRATGIAVSGSDMR